MSSSKKSNSKKRLVSEDEHVPALQKQPKQEEGTSPSTNNGVTLTVHYYKNAHTRNTPWFIAALVKKCDWHKFDYYDDDKREIHYIVQHGEQIRLQQTLGPNHKKGDYIHYLVYHKFDSSVRVVVFQNKQAALENDDEQTHYGIFCVAQVTLVEV